MNRVAKYGCYIACPDIAETCRRYPFIDPVWDLYETIIRTFHPCLRAYILLQRQLYLRVWCMHKGRNADLRLVPGIMVL